MLNNIVFLFSLFFLLFFVLYLFVFSDFSHCMCVCVQESREYYCYFPPWNYRKLVWVKITMQNNNISNDSWLYTRTCHEGSLTYHTTISFSFHSKLYGKMIHLMWFRIAWLFYCLHLPLMHSKLDHNEFELKRTLTRLKFQFEWF